MQQSKLQSSNSKSNSNYLNLFAHIELPAFGKLTLFKLKRRVVLAARSKTAVATLTVEILARMVLGVTYIVKRREMNVLICSERIT